MRLLPGWELLAFPALKALSLIKKRKKRQQEDEFLSDGDGVVPDGDGLVRKKVCVSPLSGKLVAASSFNLSAQGALSDEVAGLLGDLGLDDASVGLELS